MGDEIIDRERRQGKCRLEKNNLVGPVVRITEQEPWKQRLIEVFDNKDPCEYGSLVPWEVTSVSRPLFLKDYGYQVPVLFWQCSIRMK